MERNIWIPKMKPSTLDNLLSKATLTKNEKEDLLDFKYFMLNQQIDAYEKGLLVAIRVNQKGNAFAPKNKYWLTNIENKVLGFKSKYYI